MFVDEAKITVQAGNGGDDLTVETAEKAEISSFRLTII